MDVTSEEVSGLETVDLIRYKKTLIIEIADKSVLLQDPYLLKCGWFADPSKLPPNQYGSIYNYSQCGINAPPACTALKCM